MEPVESKLTISTQHMQLSQSVDSNIFWTPSSTSEQETFNTVSVNHFCCKEKPINTGAIPKQRNVREIVPGVHSTSKKFGEEEYSEMDLWKLYEVKEDISSAEPPKLKQEKKISSIDIVLEAYSEPRSQQAQQVVEDRFQCTLDDAIIISDDELTEDQDKAGKSKVCQKILSNLTSLPKENLPPSCCPTQKLKVHGSTAKQRQQELHRIRILVEQKRLELFEMKVTRARDQMLREQILFEKEMELKDEEIRRLNQHRDGLV